MSEMILHKHRALFPLSLQLLLGKHLYLATLHRFQPGLCLVFSAAAGISCCSQADISLCSDLQQTYLLPSYSNFG